MCNDDTGLIRSARINRVKLYNKARLLANFLSVCYDPKSLIVVYLIVNCVLKLVKLFTR